MSTLLFHSEAAEVEVSIITEKDNDDNEENEEKKAEGGGQSALPNIKKDDLARRRGQTGALPPWDHQQSVAQTAMTQSDLEKWQRLQMSTENRCLTYDLWWS